MQVLSSIHEYMNALPYFSIADNFVGGIINLLLEQSLLWLEYSKKSLNFKGNQDFVFLEFVSTEKLVQIRLSFWLISYQITF